MSSGVIEAPSSVSEIAAEIFGAEIEAARRSANLGYMARLLAQVTMPHSKPATNEYTKRNGKLILSMWAPQHVGLPYGSVPRLLLAWLTTEAVRTRERTLVLGSTLSGFMAQLGMMPTGGRWGTIPRLQTQMRKLFTSHVVCTFDTDEVSRGSSVGVASDYELWWNPKKPDSGSLWTSTVTLGESFFHDIIERPVPVDVSTLRQLTRSPLAIDLYVWMTYRYSYLDQPVEVPWDALHDQFGADYRLIRQFKFYATAALRKVALAYPEARFDLTDRGLRLLPSPPHIARRSGRQLAITSSV